MKYERITIKREAPLVMSMWEATKLYNRLVELEDKIESGEIVDRNSYLDRLMAAKDISGMSDKELEFFAKHNARVREYAMPKMSRLINENAELRERLDKAVELPRIIHPNPVEWHIQYQYESGIITEDIRFSEAEAEARLKELQGGEK